MGIRSWRHRNHEQGASPAADLSDEELIELNEILVNNENEGLRSDEQQTADPVEAVVEDIDSTDPSPNALAPWGDAGPPPINKWAPDVLGDPFEVKVIALGHDEEGGVYASVVRQKSAPTRRFRKTKPTFAVLYIHGRNDYFFHEELAQRYAQMGAAFYAVDLRKYGRSLRPWQTIGYADDLAVYDADIEVAIETIREDHPDLPLVVQAHSTGGLIATLWAWRNPGVAAGLILNSAWLELQSLTAMRPTLHRVISRLASVRPRAAVVGTSKWDSYYRSLSEGWGKSGFPLPDALLGLEDDPAVRGWKIHPQWKLPFSYPAPAAWMQAVLEGHAQVEKQVHLDCPVLAMTSTSSHSEERWEAAFFSSDVVLDADILTERSSRLSDQVTIARFPGKHDLFLSDPAVREDLYSTVRRWLKFAQIV